VALDPRSPAATALRPLTDAGVAVNELSTHDVAVAHGEFVDAVRAGVLRHTAQAELTAAIRHGEQRRLGGATAWERRGAPVDVAPALAAEIAVWMLRRTTNRLPMFSPANSGNVHTLR
jgi:isoaspartyl peptidase/L-asparaginase-like protein (Ntn-hydrolase superfamily)